LIVTKSRNAFRGFFYFRTGYAIYFAMMIGVINILTTTYFLAIDKIPSLQIIFPSFEIYLMIVLGTGLPIIVLAGWIHLKRIGTYAAEQNVSAEVQPYNYKLLPGYNKEVIGPFYLQLVRLYIKSAKGQTLNGEEIQKIKSLENSIRNLIEGGYAGKPPKGAF